MKLGNDGIIRKLYRPMSMLIATWWGLKIYASVLNLTLIFIQLGAFYFLEY